MSLPTYAITRLQTVWGRPGYYVTVTVDIGSEKFEHSLSSLLILSMLSNSEARKIRLSLLFAEMCLPLVSLINDINSGHLEWLFTFKRPCWNWQGMAIVDNRNFGARRIWQTDVCSDVNSCLIMNWILTDFGGVHHWCCCACLRSISLTAHGLTSWNYIKTSSQY